MAKSNFEFLKNEYPSLASLGELAERSLYMDPSNTLSKLRIICEKITLYLLEYEGFSDYERNDQFSKLKLLQEQADIPSEIFDTLHSIRKSGNKASHSGEGTLAEARFMLRKQFQLCCWFYELYEGEVESLEYLVPVDASEQDDGRIALLEAQIRSKEEELKAKEEKIKQLSSLTTEQKAVKKEQGKKVLRKMDESESETRDRIDKQLRDADWECDTHTINYKKCKTLPKKGKDYAIAEWPCGKGWADYALFCGEELVGIIEAKKHSKNVQSDLEQARRYSKEIVTQEGVSLIDHHNSFVFKVPFLFATNGKKYLEQYKTASGIWFWDARLQKNIERPLTSWLSPKDLKEKLAFDELDGAEKLEASPYDILTDENGLNLRDYQIDAIKALEQKIISQPEDARALIAMATGTGKTRTMIGMCYRLIKSGRFRRILFLVDRRMLGDQASDSFKEVKIEGLQTFAQIYDIQDLNAAASELDTKIHFATVQSMVQRIVYSENVPSVGEYDCIVVDEAHRGYTLDREMEDEEFILHDQLDFQSKYRQVLDHFDAYRIGLTATPAVHTEKIFGKPVFEYSYRKAVVEGYLIDFEPPYVFQTQLTKDGIKWEKGDPIKIYDPEENQIVEMPSLEDEVRVEIQGFNRKVITDSFNRTVLQELISNPLYGIHPDNPQKTLIFAATDVHADQIVLILNEEFEEMGEQVDVDAIKKITGSVDKRETLLRKFKNDLYPSIVVTVDLLTTGIDVPSICNLVFLRRVNSRILYDQMLGRATRRCDDIGKEVFRIFDCVGVTEIMAKENVMKPVAPLVTKSFTNLADELQVLEDEYLQEVKLDRIVAKLQRKVKSFTTDQMGQFERLSGEPSVHDFTNLIKSLEPKDLVNKIEELSPLWDYLDRQKLKMHTATLYSDHQDQLLETQRAYHKDLKPKDYIESFSEYVRTNRNEIMALNLVCTKPQSLTRKDLKELRLTLDEAGYSRTRLNAAFKETTNQEIVADIISLIRTASLGTPLVNHDERIKRAVEQLKAAKPFNTIQLKWLDRIEKQLLQESILTLDDLNQAPFNQDGGLRQIEKVFKGETQKIIEDLNQFLYA